MSYVDNNETELELDFQGETLDGIEEDWEVIWFLASVIRLKQGGGINGNADYLMFTKN